MKLLLIFMLTVNLAFAGYIVPNIKRNQVEFNNTGAAATLYERNNISLSYSKDTEEVKGQNEDDEDTIKGISLILNKNKLAIEVNALENDFKRNSSEFKSNGLRLNAGLNLNEALSFGIQSTILDNKDGDDANILGGSGLIKLKNGLVFGAALNKITFNGTDLDIFQYITGIGKVEKNSAYEIVLINTPGDKKDTSYTNDNISIRAEGTFINKEFQLSPVVVYSLSTLDEDSFDERTMSLDYGAELEYMLNQNFFLGGGFILGIEDFEDETDMTQDYETERASLSLFLRFKHDKFQGLFSYETINEERDGFANDYEEDEDILKVTGSYFF